MSEFVDAIESGSLESGQMRKVEIEGHEFLVVRIGDDYHVTDDRCPHLHGDLSKGTLDGSVVTCPRHGSQFDLRDGSVIRWTDFSDTVRSVANLVRHPRPLRTYEVELANGKVRIGPEKAPPAG